eukprot:gnl/MRDRNA2_/MRDRNA2_95324_c0_seq1.p1 gnl/MRDRNA2_/MRDRNA2_95324_c0~~gnl/MRDRNA2_/MRDRNA2_95324_c0_seq1.p1  ORF type:complete len:325 (+),score=65.50 gnl/MRDRNA2_/MRDRNA2_95324_c0_seq1:235-1209(+)
MMPTTSMKRRMRHHRLSFANGYRAAQACQKLNQVSTPPIQPEDGIDVEFRLDASELVQQLQKLQPLFHDVSGVSNPCYKRDVETHYYSQEDKKETRMPQQQQNHERLGMLPEADICVAVHPSLIQAPASEAAAKAMKTVSEDDLNEWKEWADEELLLSVCAHTTDDDSNLDFYTNLQWAFTPMVRKVILNDPSAIRSWLTPLCLEIMDQMALDRPKNVLTWAASLESTWKALQESLFCSIPVQCLEIIELFIGLEKVVVETSSTCITSESKQGIGKLALVNKACFDFLKRKAKDKMASVLLSPKESVAEYATILQDEFQLERKL